VTNATISEKLAALLLETRFEKLPSSAVQKAKVCILDLFGAHYAGFGIESCQAVREYIAALNGEPRATFWSTGTATSVTEAAFANSAVSHVTVFDDMHAESASHYGSVVIPAAMAVGEHLGSGGKELIAAIVCGYEAGIRVGAATLNSYFAKLGFRPSGVFGGFGSASAAGKLLGLNLKQMIHAIGLAANSGGGLMAWANEGTDDLMYQNGLASRNGVLASVLAKNGAVSPHRIFEINGGYCRAYGGTVEGMEKIAEGGHDHYKIEEVYYKAIPACAFVQSAARASLQIVEQPDFHVDAIEKVEVRIFPQGKHYPGLDYCGPYKGIMQAQMSNQFTIASILVNRRIRFEDFTRLDDPSVRSLAAKIHIFEDEEATSRYPNEQLAKIELFMKDGSRRSAVSENPQFLDEDGVLSKFRTYAGDFLGVTASEDFIDTVQRLETLDNIGRLTQIIRQKR
jgi:2-methylcitrate dehydratase PrpD